MFIVDAHQDIAYNAVCFGRDYRKGALVKRRQEAPPYHNGLATVGLPETIAGRIAIVFATIFVEPDSKHPFGCHSNLYRDGEEAHNAAMRQLDYYQRILDEDDRLHLIETEADLDSVLETWEDDKPISQRKQGLVLTIEGADPILEPQQFEEWHELGVRNVGPAWVNTRYSGGTGYPGPLTSDGFELLEVMMDLKAILDLSHMAEQAFFEAVDMYEGPIIASHSNPRQFCDSDRHLSDNMIRRLAERDGVMGIVPYNRFLDHTWRPTDGKQAMPISRVADAIDHVCQVTGSVDHVGIGSDFDGGFGSEAIPHEMDTIADLWWLRGILLSRGFDEADVAAILGGNMLRKLRQSVQE